jgi:hypothetical protein
MGRAEDLYERIIAGGETAIDEFIESKQSEELFLDFKRSKDNGAGNKLHDHDLNNLATAISGFGNSEGGVIVWGVECSKGKDNSDLPDKKHPIKNVHKFKSWLEGAISGRTVPPHTTVLNNAISVDSVDNGFVITLIPKSNHAPHQTVGELKYYIRAGSSFVPTPHGVLSGLFGKTLQPNIYPIFLIKSVDFTRSPNRFKICFGIQNDGQGIASNVYMSIDEKSKIGPNCKIKFINSDRENFSRTKSFDKKITFVSTSEFPIPPRTICQPVILDISFSTPISESLIIEVTIGCFEKEPVTYIIENDHITMSKLWDDFCNQHRNTLPGDDECNEFISKFLNIEKYQR